MLSKAPVSACIIVKNEEENIEACVSQLERIVEEIIIVDTGSTDRTKEIVEQRSIKVYAYEWMNDFAAARNYSISLASQPFILIIDADEQMDLDSAQSLFEYTANQSEKYPATVVLKNHMDQGKCVSSEITRLFPNHKGYKYEGLIHEQLTLEDKELEQVGSTNVVIHHYGYQTSEMTRKQKIERNLALIEQQLLLKPNSAYTRFQMGQTLYTNGDYENAIVYFDETIKLLSKKKGGVPSYTPTVFLSYGYCLLHEKQFATLELLLGDAIELFPDYTDLYFLYGTSLIEKKSVNQFNEIKEIFEHCLALGEVSPNKYETVEGVGSYRAAYNLGLYYEVTGDKSSAIKYYRYSAKFDFKPSLIRLKELET
ncbi:hypothetical protein YSY43_44120 [Paenibacillus sp. YSY-4.3]